MTLLDDLEKVDKTRAALQLYARRVKLARWILPDTARRFLQKLDLAFEDATRERRRILELIHADPVSRHRFKEREAAILDEALTPNPSAADLSGLKPFAPSLPLIAMADKVIALEHEEERWTKHLKDATFYYTAGIWQQDRVPVDRLTALLDDLGLNRNIARQARGAVLDGLQLRLQLEMRDAHGPASLQREALLARRREDPRNAKPISQDQENPLGDLLKKERPPRPADLQPAPHRSGRER